MSQDSKQTYSVSDLAQIDRVISQANRLSNERDSEFHLPGRAYGMFNRRLVKARQSFDVLETKQKSISPPKTSGKLKLRKINKF